MAQHDYVIDNQTFPNTRTDINNVLQAIVSANSGGSQPSTMYAYQLWYDSGNNILKIRNADNDAFITLATFNQTSDTVNFLDNSIATPLEVTGNATAGAEIRLPEDTDNGSNYVALKAASSIASNVTFILPSADGTNGQVLQTDGSQNLSFVTVEDPTALAIALG